MFQTVVVENMDTLVLCSIQ